MVIIKPGESTVPLKLLATVDTGSIKQHINKTPEYKYKRLASAQEAWVVHFTCEDGYLLKSEQSKKTSKNYNGIKKDGYFK